MVPFFLERWSVTERGWLFASFDGLNRVGARPYFSGLAGTGNFGAERSLMIGKFADPDPMPWEMIDSDHHRNDRHRPANEKEEENASLFSISWRFSQC